jgi:ubiquinone/menaquinone biosynthesis C-methylase UbiE
MQDDFRNSSYKQHEKTYLSNNFDFNEMLAKDTLNWWRHQRMYDTINEILDCNQNSFWLTLGDGNYGHGANHILSKGSKAIATDISTDYLEKAYEHKYITEYMYANAEELPFEDEYFDFSFCKESYHHFPRPMIALYEMLRVSKQGIVLVEPNDAFGGDNFVRVVLRNLKKILGKSVPRHAWEKVGNYKYTISRREIEKVALGLNLKAIAFKGLNDHYLPESREVKFKDDSIAKRKILGTIKKQDLFCKYKLTDYALLSAVIFKKKPSIELIDNMKKNGFEVVLLPSNPYMTSG